MLTWSDDQIASFFGFSAPQASTVSSWAIPAFLGAAILFVYHLIQTRVSKTCSLVIADAPAVVTAGVAPDAPKSAASASLSIELGNEMDHGQMRFGLVGVERQHVMAIPDFRKEIGRA